MSKATSGIGAVVPRFVARSGLSRVNGAIKLTLRQMSIRKKTDGLTRFNLGHIFAEFDQPIGLNQR
jgi:hypothetical protein